MDPHGNGCPGLWHYHFAIYVFFLFCGNSGSSETGSPGLEIAKWGQREQRIVFVRASQTSFPVQQPSAQSQPCIKLSQDFHLLPYNVNAEQLNCPSGIFLYITRLSQRGNRSPLCALDVSISSSVQANLVAVGSVTSVEFCGVSGSAQMSDSERSVGWSQHHEEGLR